MDFNGQNDLINLIPDRAELECEEMFAEADRLLNDGVVMEAVEKLSQIVKRNSRFGKAYNHLGWVYETKYKNTARAEEYYKAAMQYAPNYNAAYLNYSYFLSNLGRFDELKTHLDKISGIPGIAKDTIYNEYAIMYELSGDPQTAKDYYQKAAIVTLDSLKLDKYKDGIDRCNRKLDLLQIRAALTKKVFYPCMKPNFITIPFKIEGAHGGFAVVNGMAKISRAGIILEFEAKIFGMMKTGIKEVRVALDEIENVLIKKKFFRLTLEIRLNNFKTLSEIPTKEGRIILQISKDDRPRAEQAVQLLDKSRLEQDALDFIKSPVNRLFGDDEETTESEGK